MDMVVNFPGGKKVDAIYKGFTINTDQPEKGGGEGTAPSPFDLFLSSIGTCAGFYSRGVP
jgi:ribosomal protein S12 methylthiotransferase accessory factor